MNVHAFSASHEVFYLDARARNELFGE